MNKRLYDGETFDYKGFTFKFEVRIDETMREPWKEHDGHGIISDWRREGKSPGERVLHSDGRQYLYYDIAETIKLARKDGWGPSDKGKNALETRLGRKPTKRELTALAVEEDYARIRAWCRDDWHWCGVIVTMEGTDFRESLWGIDGDDQLEYLTEVAYELADECIEQWRQHGAEVNV